jgi:hypothetical protein
MASQGKKTLRLKQNVSRQETQRRAGKHSSFWIFSAPTADDIKSQAAEGITHKS